MLFRVRRVGGNANFFKKGLSNWLLQLNLNVIFDSQTLLLLLNVNKNEKMWGEGRKPIACLSQIAGEGVKICIDKLVY